MSIDAFCITPLLTPLLPQVPACAIHLFHFDENAFTTALLFIRKISLNALNHTCNWLSLIIWHLLKAKTAPTCGSNYCTSDSTYRAKRLIVANNQIILTSKRWSSFRSHQKKVLCEKIYVRIKIFFELWIGKWHILNPGFVCISLFCATWQYYLHLC